MSSNPEYNEKEEPSYKNPLQRELLEAKERQLSQQVPEIWKKVGVQIREVRRNNKSLVEKFLETWKQ